MKRRITAALMLLALTATLLISCKVSKKDQTAGGTEGVIYDTKTNVQFVLNDQTLATDLIYYIIDEVGKVTPSAPVITSDSAAKASHEIVIGESDRDVTRKAYIALERIDKENEKQVGYENSHLNCALNSCL